MLLERESELGALTDVVASAARGHGALAVVEGDPGIGKTTLLGAALDVASEDGLTLLRARGGELERELTFGVARQVLEVAVRDGALSGAARPAGAVLGVGEPDADADEPSLVHALYWATADLAARGPLCIAVDDAHWADAASLRWLVYLARRLDELPVVLLVAARTGEPGAPQALLDALTEQARVAGRLLRPSALSPPASEALVRSEAGADTDERVCRTVHELAGGNPLLVREAAATVAAEGVRADAIPSLRPHALARSVLHRLDALPEQATLLARAVAVLDRDASLGRAATLAQLDPDAAASAADALAAARILAPRPPASTAPGGKGAVPSAPPAAPLGFLHPIVRSALYDAIPAGERARWHARAAKLLDEAGEPAARAAAHLLAAEPFGDADAVRVLCTAAAGEPDPRRAAAALTRALDEPPPPDRRPAVLLALGQAEMRAYDPAAVEHLVAGRELSRDPEERLRATQALARAWTLDPRPDAALAWVRDELGALDGGDDELAREVRLALRALEVIRGRVDAGQARARRAEAQAAATPAERYLLAALAYKATDHGTAADAAELAELALAGGLSAEGIRGTGAILVMSALMNADEVERADEVARGALDQARRSGDVSGTALALTMHADTACRRGALADAEAESREALEMADEHALAWAEPVAIATLIESLGEQGRGDEADAVLASRELTEWQQGTARAALYLHARARLRLAQDRREDALADFRAAGDVMQRYGVDNPAVQGWRSGAAEALLRMGEREQAQALAEEELELGRPFAARHALGASLRVLGLAEGSIDRLREAAEALAPSPSRLLRARALVDYGAALRRAGERAASRDPLREGLDLAHRCGATQLAAHAEQELSASGARPRRRPLSGIEALTPSQLRIATMAADGLSNRDIAQALFLSIRTVENQLRQAYLKLDIGSRHDLAGALASET
jgi:DNA-binding CsgD family transcriptional regulator